MFIIDSFLGNFDRHNGNWGMLYKEGTWSIAPIFDCGLCLFPQNKEKDMEIILQSKDELNKRIYQRLTSAILENEKKINYYNFLTSTNNIDCLNSLKK